MNFTLIQMLLQFGDTRQLVEKKLLLFGCIILLAYLVWLRFHIDQWPLGTCLEG